MSKEVINYFTTAPLAYCKHTQSIIDKIMYDRWAKEEVPVLIDDVKKQLTWDNKLDDVIKTSSDKVKRRQREILDKLKKGQRLR